MDSDNDAGRPAVCSEVLRMDHSDPVQSARVENDRHTTPGQDTDGRHRSDGAAEAVIRLRDTELTDTPKKYQNTCAFCGKLYDMRIYKNGKLFGIRTKYCSEECQKAVKKRRDKLNGLKYAEQRKAIQEGKPPGRWSKYTTDVERIGTYVGPKMGAECWGCPMMGWKCRMQKIPPCRENGKRHREYMQLVAFWKDMT